MEARLSLTARHVCMLLAAVPPQADSGRRPGSIPGAVQMARLTAQAHNASTPLEADA